MNWLRQQAARRRAMGVDRSLTPRPPRQTRVDVASNDYLGLATDPDVVAAGVQALNTWGAGSTGSRLVSGHTELHAELEATLARLLQAEHALVFSSGYLANLAAVTALTDQDTLVLSDSHNHASIIDACRLSRAQVHVYDNCDVRQVRRVLADNHGRRALIVTDAVFSVDGHLAPLADLAEVAEQFSATLVVDEAHSLGVLGHGAGACVAAGVGGEHIVRTVTLSKSLGSQGGAVAAGEAVIGQLINTARSFIFDTGLAPAAAGSATAAAERILNDPELPRRALAVTAQLVHVAEQTGWSVNPHDAAVACIPLGRPQDAVRAAAACADAGVHIGCFRPPSVPDNVARLRMTGHAGLTDADIEAVREALMLARARIAA